VGKHLTNTKSRYDEADKRLAKFGDKLQSSAVRRSIEETGSCRSDLPDGRRVSCVSGRDRMRCALPRSHRPLLRPSFPPDRPLARRWTACPAGAFR